MGYCSPVQLWPSVYYDAMSVVARWYRDPHCSPETSQPPRRTIEYVDYGIEENIVSMCHEGDALTVTILLLLFV